MNSVGEFEKVSLNTFISTWKDLYGSGDEEILTKIYNKIKLPERSTEGSAGYDFFIPFGTRLKKNCTIVIPTGIKCKMDTDFALFIFPRSGLGFKHRMGLANTVGVVDSDYYNNPNNEGHILIKVIYDGFVSSAVKVATNPIETTDKGFFLPWYDSHQISELYYDFTPQEKFAQGIFLNYGVDINDKNVKKEKRVGGIGSTSNIL